MKRIVITHGLLCGLVLVGLLVATLPFTEVIGFEYAALFGYTAMVAAFLFVFFGIKAYRDRELGGRITFGRAFTAGLAMTVISSLCYVVAWQFIYFGLAPDFMDRYADYVVEQARQAGEPEEVVTRTAHDLAEFKKQYDQPLFNAAVTFIEPLPVGLLMTLISAFTLRRAGPP